MWYLFYHSELANLCGTWCLTSVLYDISTCKRGKVSSGHHGTYILYGTTTKTSLVAIYYLRWHTWMHKALLVVQSSSSFGKGKHR
jgi:hypothetical protein